jgi:diaminopropionate ammonia-lyase
MARFAVNPYRRGLVDWSAPELAYTIAIGARSAWPLHRALPGYAPTPLTDLPGLAAELGLGQVLVKDESSRFGIDAFKGLGASYAIYSVLRRRCRERWNTDLPVEEFLAAGLRDRLGAITFTAATDGNHGRAVAWVARLLGQAAVIFMPADTAQPRQDAVRREGGEVRLITGTFDDCVTACAETARQQGWQVIADTAYPGNLVIPGDIMTGYGTIFAEISTQTDLAFDAVFLPAGVGGLAAAGTAFLVKTRGADRPPLVCVEPLSSACFLESIERGGGEPIAASGDQQSIMVGLCCGLPSLLAWPVVRDGMDLFLAIEDSYALDAMRAYHQHGIVAGESGASALAGLLALLRNPPLAAARDHLGLGKQSRLLVINTEGATDPQNYRTVVGSPGQETGGE